MSDDIPPGERTFLIPPVWFLIFAGVIYATGEALPGPVYLAPGRILIAGLFIAFGFGIAIAALVQFRAKGTTYHPEDPGKTTALVTGGVYRLTRNPMYVGMALLLTALAVYLGSLLSAFFIPVFVGTLNVAQILPEERALTRLFGNEYLVFKHRTPRWLIL